MLSVRGFKHPCLLVTLMTILHHISLRRSWRVLTYFSRRVISVASENEDVFGTRAPTVARLVKTSKKPALRRMFGSKGRNHKEGKLLAVFNIDLLLMVS